MKPCANTASPPRGRRSALSCRSDFGVRPRSLERSWSDPNSKPQQQTLPQQLTRDDEFLYFGGAFVNSQRTYIAVQAFDGAIAHDALAAEHLQHAIDHPLCCFGGHHL